MALLGPDDYTKRGTCYKCETGSYSPPGMDEIRASGGTPQIGHLIGYAMGGSGKDPGTWFRCTRTQTTLTCTTRWRSRYVMLCWP